VKFGIAGTALGALTLSRTAVNAAAVGVKDGLEAVPGVGTFVGTVALGYDLFHAAGKFIGCVQGKTVD
jgi:hypothetical protein